MAKNLIKASRDFGRKAMINVKTAMALQDVAGSTLTKIQAGAILEDVDRETGEIKQVAAIVEENGAMYTSISPIVIEQMEDIIELLEDGETFDIQVISRKTKSSNRDYLSLNII